MWWRAAMFSENQTYVSTHSWWRYLLLSTVSPLVVAMLGHLQHVPHPVKSVGQVNPAVWRQRIQQILHSAGATNLCELIRLSPLHHLFCSKILQNNTDHTLSTAHGAGLTLAILLQCSNISLPKWLVLLLFMPGHLDNSWVGRYLDINVCSDFQKKYIHFILVPSPASCLPFFGLKYSWSAAPSLSRTPTLAATEKSDLIQGFPRIRCLVWSEVLTHEKQAGCDHDGAAPRAQHGLRQLRRGIETLEPSPVSEWAVGGPRPHTRASHKLSAGCPCRWLIQTKI